MRARDGLEGLAHDGVGLGRVLLEPLAELVVGDPLDQRAHRDVAELGLGLALELGIAQAHRDDGGEPLADVLAGQLVLALQEVLGLGVVLHHVGEGLLEALLVHAALDGVDAVGEGVDAVAVEAGVPLEGDLGLHAQVLVAALVLADPLEQRLLGGVDVAHEVDEAVGVLVDDRLAVVAGPLVGDADLDAPC